MVCATGPQILSFGLLSEISDTGGVFAYYAGIFGGSEEPGAWRRQFLEAVELNGNVNELGETVPPSPLQACMHFVTIFWKLLFATIPPTQYAGGWATFAVALTYIGLVTAVVGDVATLFGCQIGNSKTG